jgi:hypothetical protein
MAAQAEVMAVFPVPRAAAVFGVAISASWEAFVDFVPNPIMQPGATKSSVASWKVRAGLRSAKAIQHNSSNGMELGRYMQNTDLMGGDYNKNATGRRHPPGTNPKVCQAECDKDPACVAWTYVIRGDPAGSGDCCLKKHEATGHESPLNLCPNLSAKHCTSGVKTPTKAPTNCGGHRHDASYVQTLALLPTDTEIEIRVFTDHSICEAFVMGGLVALTAPLAPAEGVDLGVFSDTAMEVDVEAWSVADIWVTPEQVMAK